MRRQHGSSNRSSRERKSLVFPIPRAAMALRGTVKSSTTSREPHRGQRSRLSKRESGNARPCVHHRAVINSLVVLSRGARTRWGSGAAYYDRLDLLLAQGAIWLGFGILLCGLAVVGYQSFFLAP
jgi:hypothetical protein